MLHWLFVGLSHLTDYTGGRTDFTFYDVRTAQRNRCCLSSSFYSTSIFGWHCVLLAQLFKPASLANGNTVTHLTLSSLRAAVVGPHNRSPLLRECGLLVIISCMVSTGQLLKWFKKGELLSVRAVWCIIYRPIVSEISKVNRSGWWDSMAQITGVRDSCFTFTNEPLHH